MFDNAKTPLSKSQRIALTGLFLMIFLFGAWVELRGAFLKRPMTDLGVYLRAAYAVRVGGDLYGITDDNDWHYVYPPFFAIVLTPLADPPKGADRTGYLPYGLTVGLWYLLTMALGLWGCHLLAKALEETSLEPELRNPPKYSQKWWALRVLPFLILMPAIGRSQMRGQTGLIVVFLLSAMAASILRGKRFRAGLWLSVASAIKVIPTFIFLMPLWRRDMKMLFGGALGLLLTLIIIPLMAMGLDKTVTAYQTIYNEVLMAGLKGETNATRADELTCITCTDSNSPMTVLHNILNPHRPARPREALPVVRAGHWLLAVLLTATTLKAAKWRGDMGIKGKVECSPTEVLFLGQLALLMCVISPVFHPHYVSMLLPLVMVMLFLIWQRYGYGKVPFGFNCVFWLLIISHIITAIGGMFWPLRDFGLVLLSTLVLWGAGIVLMCKGDTK